MVTNASCSERTDPRYLLEALARPIVAVPRLEHRFDLVDLAMQRPQMLKQPVGLLAERAGQRIACIFDTLGHSLGDIGDALRHHNSEFAKPSTIWFACAVRALTKP